MKKVTDVCQILEGSIHHVRYWKAASTFFFGGLLRTYACSPVQVLRASKGIEFQDGTG